MRIRAELVCASSQPRSREASRPEGSSRYVLDTLTCAMGGKKKGPAMPPVFKAADDGDLDGLVAWCASRRLIRFDPCITTRTPHAAPRLARRTALPPPAAAAPRRPPHVGDAARVWWLVLSGKDHGVVCEHACGGRSLKEDPALLHSKNKDGWQPLHQAAYRCVECMPPSPHADKSACSRAYARRLPQASLPGTVTHCRSTEPHLPSLGLLRRSGQVHIVKALLKAGAKVYTHTHTHTDPRLGRSCIPPSSASTPSLVSPAASSLSAQRPYAA
jgi:hypothetical protein